MTAKEFLSQARIIDLQIDSKIAQVEQLNLLAQKCTATISDMPKNPNRGSSKLEDTVCKIVDLQAEINRDINGLIDIKQKIILIIKQVVNTELQIVLEKRYLCFESWKDISDEMNYSKQHIYRLHSTALGEVDKILKDESRIC
ncbi:MAG: DUF1492 domain-containing protein [Ruminococcaceae bacterium]|nr:DUF1492 domain-containing protein [Oscillospiraceae bacterium]